MSPPSAIENRPFGPVQLFIKQFLSMHFLNDGHKRISLDVQREAVTVAWSVAGVAAGTVIRCRPILIARRTPTRGGSPFEGTYLPTCLRTDGRRSAQPVGSLVTKASWMGPLKVVSKAPGVVG